MLLCIYRSYTAYKKILFIDSFLAQQNAAILHDVVNPSRYPRRLSYLYNTNRPLWPSLMIGNVNGLRRTIVFVTLKTRFSLTYTQTRLCHSLGS